MSISMEAHGLSATNPLAATVRRESALTVAVRRAGDVVGALLLLLIAAPFLALIAIAIRLDSTGPALYRQRRQGLGDSTFTVYKFRTMRPDADPAPHRLYVRAMIANAPDQPAEDSLYKLAVDDRITRVGRFLRRFSCDELPQLWNVVRGEMSLVGPRPAIPYEVECYPTWYYERFQVKPGMTGLWQVSGRNERTYEEMVRLDVEYVRDRTLWLDLGILARTAWVVVRAKGVA